MRGLGTVAASAHNRQFRSSGIRTAGEWLGATCFKYRASYSLSVPTAYSGLVAGCFNCGARSRRACKLPKEKKKKKLRNCCLFKAGLTRGLTSVASAAVSDARMCVMLVVVTEATDLAITWQEMRSSKSGGSGTAAVLFCILVC